MSSNPSSAEVLDFSAITEAIDRLDQAGLVAAGGVAVVNLTAIRLALADRWEGKRQQVWEHAERTLARDLGASGVIARAGDEDFLIALPGAERTVAFGHALQALKEIHQFFLGEVRPADLRLRQVHSVRGGEVTCSDLTLAASGEGDEVVAVAPPRAARRTSPVEAARQPGWKVFAAQDGAPIRVVCAVDKLILLKTGAVAGYRLRPAVADISGPTPVPVKLSAMDWRDAERVDLAIDQASDVITGQGAPLLVVPASFSTLSAQRGRRLVMERLAELTLRWARGVALEIRDLRGVPASRLAEVVAQVRPACHSVLGEVEPDRADIAAVTGCGLAGLSVRPRRDWTSDPRQVERFAGLAALARNIAPVALTRAFSAAGFALLASAGYTHATIGADQLAVSTAA